jgi:methionine-rich copper-binding protein CopC
MSTLMQKTLSAFILSFVFLFASVAHADTSVQSFQAWKTSRVDEARATIEKLQSERPTTVAAKILDKKTTDGNKTDASARLQTAQKSGRVDQRLQQAQLNLEVAQELTINDYFVLYLSQLKSREQFIEAAKKLNPDEAADLMMSYQKHLTIGSSAYDDVLPTTTLGATPAPTSKTN